MIRKEVQQLLKTHLPQVRFVPLLTMNIAVYICSGPSALHASSHGHDHSHNHTIEGTKFSRAKKFKPSEMDIDKLRSTIKQFVRDWSEEVRIIIPLSITFYTLIPPDKTRVKQNAKHVISL